MYRFTLLPIILLLLTGSAFLSSCGNDKAESADMKSSGNEDQTVTVRVTDIHTTDFEQVIDITGTVASDGDVLVPADEGGRVLAWLVPLGGRVRTGQILAQLDSALMRSSYDAAKAQYNIAQTNYEKQKKVFEEQGISELQLKTLQYQRDAAKAQLDMARERLERTRVKSPINGVLNRRMVEKGEMSVPGAPIAHVVNVDQIKLEAGIPERYAASFTVGDPVRFTVDAIDDREFKGVISFVGAAVNQDNRTIPVEVRVKNAGGVLKPAMIASMRVRLRARENSIVIPQDYVIKSDLETFIVYVEENGVARERTIRIGGSSRGKVLILDGLQAGDRLITFGQQNVADGQPVMVKN